MPTFLPNLNAQLPELRASSKRVSFRLATSNDDGSLRQLLRETPMDGPVQVTLRREPSYQLATALDGPCSQTLVAVERESGQVVGAASRSVRQRSVRGECHPIGYLSSLRIHPRFRGGLLLSRGYAAIRELHEADVQRPKWYLTTIAEGNHVAMRALTRGRANLPTYEPLGGYYTCVVPLSRKLSNDAAPIRPLQADQLPKLIDYLRQQTSRYAVFPEYHSADFQGKSKTFMDLPLERIGCAWRAGKIVGCLGVWDQSRFKQAVVEGYRMALRCLRPAWNLAAKVTGWPSYPAPGRSLGAVFAALPLADSPEVFRSLLAWGAFKAKSWIPQATSLLVGCHEADPICRELRRHGLFEYKTRVYAVHWSEANATIATPFAGRPIYLELGCL